MRLSHVSIKNFRSIANATINFDLACRILVGINESGKTNVLRALSLLDPNTLPKEDDIREFAPNEDPSQEAYVRFIFTLDEKEKLEAYEQVALKVRAKNIAKPIIEIAGQSLSLDQFFNQVIKETVYIIDIRGKKKYQALWSMPKSAKIIGQWKKVKPTPTPAPNTLPDGTAALGSTYSIIDIGDYPDTPATTLSDLSPGELNSFASIAIQEITKANLPDCLFWSYNEANLLPGQIDLDSFAADPETCLPLKHMFELGDTADIQAAIESAKQRSNGIRNLLKRVSEQSTKHMHNVWKEYQGIKLGLQQNGDNIEATIDDTHNVYDLSRRSDGFKRFITFLLMVSAKAKTRRLENTLYLHDEPDTSLHPSGARHLREELIKISTNNNYVVYSTHSIFMIDRSRIDRHFLVRKKNEITTLEQVNESNIVDEEVIYNALGSSIFESLKAKNIVFEGWRDKRLFQIALSKLPSEQKALKKTFSEVGACHAKGVKDISRITPMLELAHRECIIISDGDQPALEQQKAYNGYGAWLRYDELLKNSYVVTAEDFIRPEAFQPILKNIRSENPSLAEFQFDDLKIEGGRLAIIEKWLKAGGIGKDATKPILNRIKEVIFSKLTPKNIEANYFTLLQELSLVISNTPSETNDKTEKED